MIRNTDTMGWPPKAAPVFLIILYHRYLWIFLIYSLYIPYIFPKYVPYIFPCVFLTLWSQQCIFTIMNLLSKTCDFVKRS